MGHFTRTVAVTLCALWALAIGHPCIAGQTVPASQPLNASVSDFGTSFTFSPAPVCPGCLEVELGVLSLQQSRLLPAVFTVAPFPTHTDVSVLVNLVDSEVSGGRRAVRFGNRFDFIVRQQVFARGGFLFSVDPEGTVFSRGPSGGRAGAAVAAQYGRGDNLISVDFGLTRAVGRSPDNPASDYQGAIDYSRTLSQAGVSVFAGLLHEMTTGQPQAVSTEQGLVLPFRNGQVELAMQQIGLNTNPLWQFQARVIVNFGNLLRR